MNLDTMKAALDAADNAYANRCAEHKAALAVLAEASSAHDLAERAYDREPTDTNGEEVLACESKAKLATLRVNHAATREKEAARVLAAAKRDHECAIVRAEIERHAHAYDHACSALAKLRADREHHSPGERLAGVFVAVLADMKQNEAAERTAEKGRNEARAALFAAEERLAALDPSTPRLASALDDALFERASAADYRARIAPDVEIIAHAFRAIIDAAGRIDIAYRAAEDACEAARARGIGLPKLDPAHRVIHVLRALGGAVPEGYRAKVESIAHGSIARLMGCGTFAGPALTPNTASALQLLPFLAHLLFGEAERFDRALPVDALDTVLGCPDQHAARTVKAALDKAREADRAERDRAETAQIPPPPVPESFLIVN